MHSRDSHEWKRLLSGGSASFAGKVRLDNIVLQDNYDYVYPLLNHHIVVRFSSVAQSLTVWRHRQLQSLLLLC
jgi:hypothetical protein